MKASATALYQPYAVLLFFFGFLAFWSPSHGCKVRPRLQDHWSRQKKAKPHIGWTLLTGVKSDRGSRTTGVGKKRLEDACIEYFTSPNPMWGCVYCTVVAAGRGILFLVF